MFRDLNEIQAFIAGAVQRPEPLGTDPAMVEAARAIATGNDRLSPVEQIDVYREQFFLRHVGSLREDYPALEHLVGWDAFEELARAYLAAIPPSGFSLRDLGARLPEFLRSAAPWRDDLVYADLARLEWAYVDAWDAADLPPLDPVKIAQMPEEAWPKARVVFHPSLTLLDLCFPAHLYRSAVRGEENPARPRAEGRTTCAVYMGKTTLEAAPLEPEAWELVRRLAEGAPLGRACEETVAATGADPAAFEAKLGGWFQEWTARGWVVDLAISSGGS
jgi:hypothetical protein